MLHDKASHDKFEKTEITRNALTDHSGMKLGINNKEKFRNFKNMWKLHNTGLNNRSRKKEKNPGKIRKYFEIKKNETQHTNLGDAVTAVLKGISIAVNTYVKKDLKSIT